MKTLRFHLFAGFQLFLVILILFGASSQKSPGEIHSLNNPTQLSIDIAPVGSVGDPSDFSQTLLAWCGDGCDPEIECCHYCVLTGCIDRQVYSGCSPECF